MDYKIIVILLILFLLILFILYEMRNFHKSVASSIEDLNSDLTENNKNISSQLQIKLNGCVNKVQELYDNNVRHIRRIGFLNKQPITNISKEIRMPSPNTTNEQTNSNSKTDKKSQYYMSENTELNSDTENNSDIDQSSGNDQEQKKSLKYPSLNPENNAKNILHDKITIDSREEVDIDIFKVLGNGFPFLPVFGNHNTSNELKIHPNNKNIIPSQRRNRENKTCVVEEIKSTDQNKIVSCKTKIVKTDSKNNESIKKDMRNNNSNSDSDSESDINNNSDSDSNNNSDSDSKDSHINKNNTPNSYSEHSSDSESESSSILSHSDIENNSVFLKVNDNANSSVLESEVLSSITPENVGLTIKTLKSIDKYTVKSLKKITKLLNLSLTYKNGIKRKAYRKNQLYDRIKKNLENKNL